MQPQKKPTQYTNSHQHANTIKPRQQTNANHTKSQKFKRKLQQIIQHTNKNILISKQPTQSTTESKVNYQTSQINVSYHTITRQIKHTLTNEFDNIKHQITNKVMLYAILKYSV